MKSSIYVFLDDDQKYLGCDIKTDNKIPSMLDFNSLESPKDTDGNVIITESCPLPKIYFGKLVATIERE